MAKQYIQIDSEQHETEFALIREYAEQLGLKNTTALLLHIRQTLPIAIQNLKDKKELAAPSDDNSPSSEVKEHTPKEGDCQEDCEIRQDAEAAHV